MQKIKIMTTNTLKIIRVFLFFLIFAFVSCSSDESLENSEDPTSDLGESNRPNVEINIEDYQHQFIGGGTSIGLFLGHHYSMNAASQDLAIQYMANDLNMKYFQDYIEIYPEDDPEYYDRRADYVLAAKQYKPDLEFSLVGQKFPNDLMVDKVINGQTLKVLDTDDPNIYDRVAMWYFRLLKGFHDRGVTTEILNVVNEPDLDRTFRKHHYGLNGDTKEAVARIFEIAVPKFKALISDPTVNTTGMPQPLIMGPSSISPVGCIEYIQYIKTNYPDAWNNIDIVATHQYENGARVDLFRNIQNISEGKPIYQSETHALKGDGITVVNAPRPLEAALSLSNLFTTAVNNGVSSWFYFENNYPNDFHPGGLMQVSWGAQAPIRYKHYFVFQQLTSLQPPNSSVVTASSSKQDTTSDVIAFRKENENDVYLTYTNYAPFQKFVSVTLKNTSGNALDIKSYQVTSTNADDNAALLEDENLNTPQQKIEVIVSGHSVNTIKLKIDN